MKRLPSFGNERLLAERLKTPDAQTTYEKLIIGAQLKKWREKLGITQKDLAKKLKTTQSVIARMEAGRQNFGVQTLVSLAFALGRKLHIRLL